MTSAKTRAALSADRIDLIDEDDRGSIFLSLLEEVTNTRCADADEHLNEIRARDREEINARLARNCARKQSFTGTRRAHQQHALRDTRADLIVLFVIFKKIYNFLKLSLFLVCARNVGKSRLFRVGGFLCIRLAEARHLARARAPHHPHEEEDHHAEHQQSRYQIEPKTVVRNGHKVVFQRFFRVFRVVKLTVIRSIFRAKHFVYKKVDIRNSVSFFLVRIFQLIGQLARVKIKLEF